ncbi:MAG TPA: sugar phosphate isomerase/epimerase family protein [Pirellulaceae bacterium]|nr:sugar phosphate isomerase/epimerase family protein [Pirellulaceae bacterium]HMO92612.1 sugar phosphate isomerase/epimerase family protein [Pirellulaceae bacterium]HMP70695.1 sugar phosphate isomerase/epimerase family protein [Pirellulaceae bacterium]
MSIFSRRRFLKSSLATSGGLAVATANLDFAFADLLAGSHEFTSPTSAGRKLLFDISLAQWSLHRSIRGGKLDNLEFPEVAKREFGIEAIEYVNQFFMDKVKNQDYLSELKKRADDQGVKTLLIMCDGVGQLGAPDEDARTKAVEGHYAWVEASKFLGGHSIRVNAGSSGSREEQAKLAADGLARLSEFAGQHGLNVIVENHGGWSSDGSWLAGVIKEVGMDNCGTLPDFGNFNTGGGRSYDRYLGVEELMPFAKAVSAKSHDFDDDGNEIHTDYLKMMRIVLQAGYRGFVGIEYEGGKLGEFEGILATKSLLERVREELASEFDEG